MSIKVYLDNDIGLVVFEGLDTHQYLSGDLEAVEENGKVSVRRRWANLDKVFHKVVYTLFTDVDGDPIGASLADTVTNLNTIFNTAPTGATGATVAVGTVTTGLVPEVLNVGTANAAVLNFTLPSSGGSSKHYSSFFLTGAGLTGLSSTALTLTVNSTGETSNGFTLLNNLITSAVAGVFKIDANVYLNNSGTNRSEYSMWIERNGTEIPGSRFASYQRGYDSGMSSNVALVETVAIGDVFRLRCQRTDGGASGYQDANGTRINFVEIG